MSALLVVMALQAVVASSVAVATSFDPIEHYPCRVGRFGTVVTLTIAGVEAIALAYLSRLWPRSASGERKGFRGWVSFWVLFTVVAAFAHLRSAALCTV